MMINLALIALAVIPPKSGIYADRHHMGEGPQVEVWTNKDSDDPLQRGEEVRVYFRTSESGYVTVFRIDTDGRVRVIHPTEPWEDNYARAGQRYEVRGYGDRRAFIVDDQPGEGYIFAVASRDPYNYGNLVRGDHWDYRVIADGGRVTGDPYVALTDLVDRIIPPNYSEYTYDVLPYFVERHYQYPRFLCYDCHAYASYSYWNPYSYSCFRFRIVVYDDYYYYPYRRYRGARVVYRTSPRLAPRYVFKDRAPSEAFVTTVRERPVDRSGRRLLDDGYTSASLGSAGRLPTPINTESRRPATSSDPSGSGVGSSRRGLGETQNQGTQAQPDGRQSPADRPMRQGDQSTTTGQNTGRRPADNILPPVTSGDERQPTLERRDPRQQPGRETDQPRVDRQPVVRPESEQPRVDRQPVIRPEVERPRVERQPEVRQPDRQPERQQERPRIDRQPEVRQPEARQQERPRVDRQPEARQPDARQPERRAEPKAEPSRSEPGRSEPSRSAPSRAPESSSSDDNSGGRRRS